MSPHRTAAESLIADLTLQLRDARLALAIAERALISKGDATSLPIKEPSPAPRRKRADGTLEKNAALQKAVARKTLEMEIQSGRLEQSEQRFSSAFEHAPIGVALVSLQGRWLKVNPAFSNLVGYSETELSVRTFQDITHPDDMDIDSDIVRRMIAGDMRTYQIEKRYIHADGHFVPVSLNVSLARDGNAQPLYFIGHMQDISARKEAENRRRMEEERNVRQRGALIAFTREFAIGDNLSATIQRLTKIVAQTLGIARVSVWRYNADHTSLHCVDLYEQESDHHSAGIELTAAAYPIYFNALTGMEVIAAEDAHRDPRTAEFSGNYLRPLGITSMLDAPIHLGGKGEGVLCHEHIGPPRRWTADEETFAVAVANRVSLALESSERQRVADELRAALAQIGQMLAHSPAVIFRLKVEGAALFPIAMSDNIQTLLGYTVAETMTYEWWLEHLNPDDRERACASTEELMRQDSVRFECRLRHKDGGYRWIEESQCLLRDTSGEPMETVGVWMNITERKEAEIRLENLHKELMEVSRQAGMAEVATSVLHNVGNVLNSVNISCSVVMEKVRKSRIGSVGNAANLLNAHLTDLAGFFSTDPAGQRLPGFLDRLAHRLSEEQSDILKELELLDRNIDHIKVIVSMQQNYAKISGTTEIVNVTDLVEDSLRLNGDSLSRHGVAVVRDYSEVPTIRVQKHKVLQILVNLIQNAKHACQDSGRSDKQIIVRVEQGENSVRIRVVDNGIGIPTVNRTRIFAHGFTTKSSGHGFGLHSGALAAKEMGGRLVVENQEEGTGASFALQLPISPPSI